MPAETIPRAVAVTLGAPSQHRRVAGIVKPILIVMQSPIKSI